MADERVLAFFELEPEKIGGRDELRLARLANQTVDARGAPIARRTVRCFLGGPPAQPAPLALPLPIQEFRLVLSAIRFANRHAVELERAADEIAVANEPTVLALLAPDRLMAGSTQVYLLLLFEDVLLKLLPVVVAAGEHPLHEGVEVVLSGNLHRRAA